VEECISMDIIIDVLVEIFLHGTGALFYKLIRRDRRSITKIMDEGGNILYFFSFLFWITLIILGYLLYYKMR